MKDLFQYAGSMPVKINKIEVYGTGDTLAVPYYHINLNNSDEEIVVGGIRIDRSDSPVFDAREERPFIYSLARLFTYLDCEVEEAATALREEYESFKSRKPLLGSEECDGSFANVDIFVNKETGESKFCVGGSNVIYRKLDDGQLMFLFDEEMIEKIRLDNSKS